MDTPLSRVGDEIAALRVWSTRTSSPAKMSTPVSTAGRKPKIHFAWQPLEIENGRNMSIE